MIIWDEKTSPEDRERLMRKLWSDIDFMFKIREIERIYGQCFIAVDKDDNFELYYVNENGELRNVDYR